MVKKCVREVSWPIQTFQDRPTKPWDIISTSMKTHQPKQSQALIGPSSMCLNMAATFEYNGQCTYNIKLWRVRLMFVPPRLF
jgi:hypothetical protein